MNYFFKKEIITLLVCLSFIFSSRKNIIIGIIGSFTFTLIESFWKLYKENSFYSTFEQFVINVMILPFSLYYYNYYTLYIFNILFYPLLLWSVEIISHICLLTLFGVNNAWSYSGKYCYFDGSVNLKYVHYWWALGILNYNVYPILY